MTTECGICHEEFGSASHVPVVGGCGHSICTQCALKIDEHQRSGKCPICQQVGAFVNASKNFQMLDVMEELVRLKQVNSKSPESSKINEDKKILAKCRVCSDFVRENKLRICLDCCQKNGSIFVLTDGSCGIIDKEKVESDAMCASCCLEGDHSGHKTSLLLPIKIHMSATKDFETLMGNIREKYGQRFSSDREELFFAIAGLGKPLKVLQERAKLAGSGKELENLVSKGKDLEGKIDKIMLECHESMMRCAEQIQEAACRSRIDGACGSKLLPFSPSSKSGNERKALEAFIGDISVLNRTLTLNLWNKDADKSCHFEISGRSAYCRVTPHAGQIPPAGRAQLKIVHEAELRGRTTDEHSLEIRYCSDTESGKLIRKMDTLVVPYSLPK